MPHRKPSGRELRRAAERKLKKAVAAQVGVRIKRARWRLINPDGTVAQEGGHG